MKSDVIRGDVSTKTRRQQELSAFLRTHGVVQLAEIRRVGITADVSRLVSAGVIAKLGRRLYQLYRVVAEVVIQ